MLGPASVRGLAVAFHRSAARELVVYLAFHREGVRHGEWSLALWPDRPVSPATVHSTASDARRALGRAADGAVLLPCGPLLRLHRSVTTDVDRFALLSASNDPRDRLDAFQLIRGPLFGGLRQADWAVLDGTQAQIERLVVQAVLQGVGDLRHSGRAAELEWMVRRSLLVSPYDERLYRAMLRALAAQGNRAGLRVAMSQFVALARGAPVPSFRGLQDAGLDPLHPETTALYRRLLCG